ncbi:MAG TPA: helicase HerA-like domain-containing protein [Solirubrobacteraceae bacterium]|nr:helicase HerA-like domain-containing protein [Solirubrobacteraceae bacterium]
MKPPDRSAALRRFLVLMAFGVLILLPPTAAIGAVAAMLAFSAARTARRVAHRRSPRGREDEVVLGVDSRGRLVRLADGELAAHGLILGASGAGKTTTLLTILTDQIARGRPVVAIDMKGSPAFVHVLADAAAAAGRPIKVWTLDGGAHWNPLAHGNATELKDKIMATERFTEPHYQRAAERYVQTVLQVLARAHPGVAPTLAEVVHLMDPRRLATALRALDRPHRERVQDYLAGLTADQHSAIRGLQTRLAVLTESHTGPLLAPAAEPAGGPDTIDLRDALRGREVVVFSLNSSRYGKLASQLGTLVVQDLVAASGDRLDAGPGAGGAGRAMIGIDEFSALGADHVIALLARGRESGMTVLVATQELADLERAAAGLRDQVLGVTAIKIAHRQEVPASANTVAQMAGTEKVWEVTRQLGGWLLGGAGRGRGTKRQVEEFIVHPNDIKGLRTGEAVVISKLGGGRPKTVRVNPPPRRPPPDLGR